MKRKISSLMTKLKINLSEKRYKNLKYLFFKEKLSDKLIVSFSGFTGNGPARYNYRNTIKTINANQLFILDDFGYKKQGSYYLGENGSWFLPEIVEALINKIQVENNIKQIVMIGSSKGGSAALFYSIKLQADACIIGAPQYYIGDYLTIDRHLPILEGIMGDNSQKSIDKLNTVLSNCISLSQKIKPDVYIHYSPMEHTYSEHIVYMIKDLKDHGYNVIEDSDYEYTEHGNVAKFFPKYLQNVLNVIIDDKTS